MNLNIPARYPLYMYHKEHNEPKLVNSNAEEVDMVNKGWSAAYIHKDYPKWVKGQIVQSKAEEKQLLEILEGALVTEPEVPKVTKEDVRKKPGKPLKV